jgi:CHAT domain-containing protein
LDGLVRLARARAEDLGNRQSERQNLVDAEQEKAVLGRLAAVTLPDSALGELRNKGIHGLLIIPDGSLHYVPFAMLRLKNENGAGAHYLVEEFATSYIPAMTTLETIRKQKQEREHKRPLERRALLAFANPAYGDEKTPSMPFAAALNDDMLTRMRSFRADNYKNAGLRLTSLPETEQEAMRAASLFAPPKAYRNLLSEEPEGQAVVFTGRGASEEEVKQLLAAPDGPKARRQWQYVLFSTHGLADTFNGMLSCLALASPAADSGEDGFLQAQEVMNLELDADLVMLSACQTGLGRLRGGEGLVGLGAAFFYAGAQSVCASLWQVPSGPTSQLVPELFKRLKDGNCRCCGRARTPAASRPTTPAPSAGRPLS